tara:strand:+ start:2085 stop:2567 length:483 start_codon:yes stop_codon:yes gene_type:complete
MKEKWLFLRTGGEIEKIVDEEPTLAEMQEFVGGLIEYTHAEKKSNFFVNCKKSTKRARKMGDNLRYLRVMKQDVLDIVVNEEGLLIGLEPNHLATLAKYNKSFVDLHLENIMPLVGNAIIHYAETDEPMKGERRYTIQEASYLMTGHKQDDTPMYGYGGE